MSNNNKINKFVDTLDLLETGKDYIMNLEDTDFLNNENNEVDRIENSDINKINQKINNKVIL